MILVYTSLLQMGTCRFMLVIGESNAQKYYSWWSNKICTSRPGTWVSETQVQAGVLDVVGINPRPGPSFGPGQSVLQLLEERPPLLTSNWQQRTGSICLLGSLSLNTSSTTAGTMQLISKGSLILDTSSSLGGTAPIILQGERRHRNDEPRGIVGG